MKKFYIIFIIMLASYCYAAVDLPWSTTYDCDDWLEYNDALNCDGLEKALNNVQCGLYEEIAIGGNNPGGDGGKGQIHYYDDGENNGTGGTQIKFNTPQNEIWIRWYINYPVGFTWTDNSPYGDKILYVNNPAFAQNPSIAVGFRPGNTSGFWNDGQTTENVTGGASWSSMMGGTTGDGEWHYWEVHIKMSSAPEAADGEEQMWFDGVEQFNRTDVQFSDVDGIQNITIGSNYKYAANGGCVGVLYDDVAVSNTGYIGSVDGSPPVVDAGIDWTGIGSITWTGTGSITWQ